MSTVGVTVEKATQSLKQTLWGGIHSRPQDPTLVLPGIEESFGFDRDRSRQNV